jgi:hypothetical protein
MEVTGFAKGPGLVCPLALASAADGAMLALKHLAPDAPLPQTGALLLGERARLLGLAERCTDAAGRAAVCAELGVSRATLFAWRREDAEVGALPAARVKRAPGTVVKGDTREARAARRESTRENA